MSAANLRARVRAEMTEEIKTVARRHLATEGANLSLRAVARDLGMASSAVYRYFASRDELLTALIIDAYDAVGAAAEQAAARGGTPLERWLAVCHATRDWALANPHEWALIYGSPVPGYQAPRDTVGSAIRVMLALGTIVAERDGVGRTPAEGRFTRELAAAGAQLDPPVPGHLVGDTAAGLFHLMGAVSAELFGQLNNTVEEDRRGFFEYQMRGAATLAGLT